MAKILIGHERKERAAVVPHTLANGARKLIVGPGAGAGLGVRSDVRSGNLSREALEHGHVLARAERSGRDRRVVLRPVVLRVTIDAVEDVADEILAAREALRSAIELARGERARLRPYEGPPADGDGDAHGEHDHQREDGPHQYLSKFLH